MRLLLPPPHDAKVGPYPAEVDPAVVYEAMERPPPAGRPWVMINMVTSADGGTAVDGVSRPLGGPPDQRVFSAVRAAADVILVGAGTVRAEHYGRPRTPERLQARRRQRGQAPFPRVAVVSASLCFDGDALGGGAPERPLVFTVAGADAGRRAGLEGMAEVVEAGVDQVDLGRALADLGARGARVVLVEGGPSLNGQLVEADLVDELCLTVSPCLVAGSSARVVADSAGGQWPCQLTHVLEEEGFLFLRYRRRP